MSEKEIKQLLDAILGSVGKSMPEHLFNEAYEFVRNGEITRTPDTESIEALEYILSTIEEDMDTVSGHGQYVSHANSLLVNLITKHKEPTNDDNH